MILNLQRCDHPSCPNPVFKPTVSNSHAVHGKNHHERECVVTYQRPYRTQRLERNEQGVLACPWCPYRGTNAGSAKGHAWGKRGCPGPPVVKKDE